MARKKEKENKQHQKESEKDTKHIECEEKIAKLEDQLKRSVADYQNLEKRHQEDKKQFIKYANYELLTRLLPAFDSLFIAEKYIEDDGLKFTVKSINDTFEQLGVKRIETEGKTFDATIMECVEKNGEGDEVTEEVRPGFFLHDKVLRPAHVKVGKQ